MRLTPRLPRTRAASPPSKSAFRTSRVRYGWGASARGAPGYRGNDDGPCKSQEQRDALQHGDDKRRRRIDEQLAEVEREVDAGHEYRCGPQSCDAGPSSTCRQSHDAQRRCNDSGASCNQHQDRVYARKRVGRE